MITYKFRMAKGKKLVCYKSDDKLIKYTGKEALEILEHVKDFSYHSFDTKISDNSSKSKIVFISNNHIVVFENINKLKKRKDLLINDIFDNIMLTIDKNNLIKTNEKLKLRKVQLQKAQTYTCAAFLALILGIYAKSIDFTKNLDTKKLCRNPQHDYTSIDNKMSYTKSNYIKEVNDSIKGYSASISSNSLYCENNDMNYDDITTSNSDNENSIENNNNEDNKSINYTEVTTTDNVENINYTTEYNMIDYNLIQYNNTLLANQNNLIEQSSIEQQEGIISNNESNIIDDYLINDSENTENNNNNNNALDTSIDSTLPISDNDNNITTETEVPNVLNSSNGTISVGPSGGKETYYNLNMNHIVERMRAKGFDEVNYPYWIRQDGAKMLGNYVMVAANLEIHPRGSVVATTLGPGIVCDTGEFAKTNKLQLDIATNWVRKK